MPRKFIAALLLVLVLPQSTLAQNAGNTGPLTPGKPAGIHQAQMAYSGAIFIGALVLIGAVGFLVSTRRYVVPGSSSNSASSTSG
jgi:hypothetical protein